MENNTHRQPRWRGKLDTARHEPEVTERVVTKPRKEKPARASRRQLGPVLALLRRVAAGGDATCAVDAASLVPMMERAVASALPGQPRHRASYVVTLADGSAVQVQGLVSAAKASGKAKSTLANALSIGRGTASFPARDEHGNPAAIVVRREVGTEAKR